MKKRQDALPVPSTDEEGGNVQEAALGCEFCSRSGSMCLVGSWAHCSGKSSSAQAGNFWAAVSFS